MTYPIILAHGVCRFDIPWAVPLRLDNTDNPVLDRLHYFRGLRSMLGKKGYRVFHSRVSWAAGVETRAEDLRRNLLRVLRVTGAPKVNIIAHSMGGLDARHMLFKDRHGGKIHERVASLTTISTPHRGSPFADLVAARIRFALRPAARLGLDLSALEDLTVEACTAFDTRPDVREFQAACEGTIQFRTYAGRHSAPGISSHFLLSHRILTRREGDNDGHVSVASATWNPRYFRGILERTDHIHELGWWTPDQLRAGEGPVALLRRIHAFYGALAAQLP